MPTIIDVAQLAGVSKSTISRYLNGEMVKESNRIKIDMAIKELNYHINPIARGLKTSKSYTIGVIIPNLTDLFVTYIIQSCEQFLNDRNYSVILCDARENPELEKERLDFLMGKRVDGIIMEPCGDDGEHIKRVVEEGIPIVLIDRKIKGLSCDCVLVDNAKGVYDGVAELINRGHSDIGIINGPQYIYTAVQRFKGYRNALKDYDISIKEEYIKNGFYKKQEGKNAFKELMTMKNPPTAIFITNYFMSVGAIEAIFECGYNIPGDVSLITFDSMELSNTVDLSTIIKPEISTIRQPMAEIGEAAARILMDRIENGSKASPNIKIFNTKLNITDSIKVIK